MRYIPGMTPRMKRIAAKTLLVTVLATAATCLLAVAMRWYAGMSMDWLGWIECLVIPPAVSIPIGWYVFSQGENLLAAHSKLEKAHKDLNRALDRMAFVANHDHLTGLLNREGFLKRIEEFRDRNASHVILIVDADHFKRINDRHGHAKGDEALVKIARALQYAVRPGDIVGRLGGEEFGILLGSVGLEQGTQLAELVRRQVQCIPWSHGADGTGLTVSVGGAVMERGHAKVADVLRQADRCLYEAKRLGRNQVAFNCAVSAVA